MPLAFNINKLTTEASINDSSSSSTVSRKLRLHAEKKKNAKPTHLRWQHVDSQEIHRTEVGWFFLWTFQFISRVFLSAELHSIHRWLHFGQKLTFSPSEFERWNYYRAHNSAITLKKQSLSPFRCQLQKSMKVLTQCITAVQVFIATVHRAVFFVSKSLHVRINRV